MAFKEADGDWKPYCRQQGSTSATDVVEQRDVEEPGSEADTASSQPSTSPASDPIVLPLPSANATDDRMQSVDSVDPDIQTMLHEQPDDKTSCQSHGELSSETLVCKPQMMLNDPATFAGRRVCREEDVVCHLKAGACQPHDYSFPITDGRYFQIEWCVRKLPDNSTRVHQWLTYSVSLDRMYCLPCTLFSGPGGSATWTISGNNDWSSGLRDIIRHVSTTTQKLQL